MNKKIFGAAVGMSLVLVAIIVVACMHPELSFPWSAKVNMIIFALYVDLMAALYVFSFWKKGREKPLAIAAFIIELVAIFMIVIAIMSVTSEGKMLYLPIALGLNIIACGLNLIQQIRNKRAKKQE